MDRIDAKHSPQRASRDPLHQQRRWDTLRCRVMTMAVVVIIGCLPMKAQKTRVPLAMSGVTVEQVLNKIEENSDYVFLFNENVLDKNRIVTVKESSDIPTILATILQGTHVGYKISDKQIILAVKEEKAQTATRATATGTELTLTGVVKDKNGEPMMGVTVLVPGTTSGTSTGMDGRFSLKVRRGGNIEFHYLGYVTQQMKVVDAHPLTIVMRENDKQLGEAVVTAMGIMRKPKSLTYATQKVKGEELTRVREVNLMNSLQGKSAGLLITPNTSGAGGGASRIILRGQSSMLGNNQPLIVLDGIPLSNGMSGQTSDLVTGTSRDGGDILSTINPDDVADMQILKGPNAAALYGSAANNGVILITTKSGKKGKVSVDFTSNVTFETPLVYPRQQTEYAPEIIGSTIEYNGWGKRISDLTDDEMATFPYLTRSPRNNVKDFFRTGETFTHSIALSSGTENSTTYFSYSNTYQKGLIPRNAFTRNSFLLKQTYKMLDNKLTVDLSLNYITQVTKNRPIIGKAKGVLPGLYRTPAAVDLRYFDVNRTKVATAEDDITQIVTDETGKIMRQGNSHLIGQPIQNFPWLNQVWINNPYFMIDAMDDADQLDRVMGTASLKYTINKELTAQARLSLDKNINEGTVVEYASIRRDKDQTLAATYWNSKSQRQEIYGDAMLTYTHPFGDFSFTATGGTSMKRVTYRNWHTAKYNDSTYVEPNDPWPNDGWNGSQNPDDKGRLGASDSYYRQNWEAAIFATSQVGYKEKAYLDFSIRNDWNKAFQQFVKPGDHKKSFAYWSVGGNALLKDLLNIRMEQLSSLKLRASYSVVGNSIPDQVYSMRTKNPLTGAWSASGVEFHSPKPETTESFEYGVDGSFFQNSLDFDLTLYQSVMKNQFLYVSSGTVTLPANTGKVRNRGVELSVNYRQRITKDLRWTTGVNLAYNTNKILATYLNKETGAQEELRVGPSSLGIVSKYMVGGSYGDLYGRDFQYGKDGKIVLSDGVPVFNSEYTRFLGNTTAKFNFGFSNTFTYKGASLYILLDGKIGGKVLSLTQAEMDEYGLSKRTQSARDNNGGMVTLPDGQQVTARNYYTAVGSEQFDCVFDASNVRLREVSLSYTFPNLFGPMKNLTLSFVAHNLGFLYKNSPVDPDMSASAANAVSGIESFSLPTTRSFGFNLKISL